LVEEIIYVFETQAFGLISTTKLQNMEKNANKVASGTSLRLLQRVLEMLKSFFFLWREQESLRVMLR